ncbi:I12_0309p, partial [Colletotrichum higginsianum]
MLTRTLAAALSRAIDFRMVAPSFVTMISPVDLDVYCRILSIPLGPRVLLTRSPTAMAPTKAERRAFSPFSSVVPSSKIC